MAISSSVGTAQNTTFLDADQMIRFVLVGVGSFLAARVLVKGLGWIYQSAKTNSVAKLSSGLLAGYLGWNGLKTGLNLLALNYDPKQVRVLGFVHSGKLQHALSKGTFEFGWGTQVIASLIDVGNWKSGLNA